MMEVKLISYTKNPLMTCAQAAALCYASEPSLKIVKHCIKSNHLSVMEHCSFTFIISGVSRSCIQQLTRHRLASYSQESQRYVPLDNANLETDFVYPADLQDKLMGTDFAKKDCFIKAYNDSILAYKNLKRMGYDSDEARGVIPNNCATKIAVTMNLRQLAHFMNERLCRRASKEICRMAIKMKEAILNEVPQNEEESEIFEMLLVPKCEIHSDFFFCPEVKGCGRHTMLKDIKKQLEIAETTKKQLKNFVDY